MPLWTQEQVDALNRYQQGYMHPFTCANRGDGNHPTVGGDHGILTATVDGWICNHCDYTQDWAHDFMLDPTKDWSRNPIMDWLDNGRTKDTDSKD